MTATTLENPRRLLESRIPHDLLYAKVWGSWSHNTQVAESDVDYLGVYQASTRQLLSLHAPAESIDGSSPDFQAHELGKFCHLLMKGNPGIVECLFTEDMQWMTPAFEELRAMRDMFLNRKTLHQYLGYCRGQLERLRKETRLHTKGGSYNTKWAYHLVRLSYDALRIAEGRAPVVFKEGDELALLMRVRNGEFEPSGIEAIFTDIEREIEGVTLPDLREAADVDALNEWLVAQRVRHLQGSLNASTASS